MEKLIVQCINGFIYGLIYALIASGLTLIWGIMDFINLAHGELYMLGAFLGWVLISSTVGNFWLSFLISVVIVTAIGLGLRKTVLAPIIGKDPLFSVLATYGVSLVFQQTALALFGPACRSIAMPLEGKVLIFSREYSVYRLLVVAIAFSVIGGVWLFMKKSKWGIWIRAVAQDKEMAPCLGIPVSSVYTIVFLLASGMAAVAGVAISPIFGISANMGREVILTAFIIVMIGGPGNYVGSVIAAILVGEVIAISTLWFTPTQATALCWILLLGTLLIRPQGLFRR